jgi:hypothetical protein
MGSDDGPEDDDILVMLDGLLSRSGAEDLRTLLRAFLRTREGVARDFIAHSASIMGAVPGQDPGWRALAARLEDLESAREERERREGAEAFLAGLEEFRRASLAGDYSEEADFEEKRRAYADGDVYFEDFQGGFVDQVQGFQRFLHETKVAERYMRAGEHAVAARALDILLDIYDHDTGGERCFVYDDDFPDLDLSEVDGVDAKGLRRHRQECQEALEAGSGGTAGVGGGPSGGARAVPPKGGRPGSPGKEAPGRVRRGRAARPRRKAPGRGGRVHSQ